MRQFASAGFRVWNLSREAKLVYTFFGVFSLLALASSVAFYEDLVGVSTAGIKSYYAGETSAQTAPAAPRATGGPAIELPDEGGGGTAATAAAPTDRLTVAVTYRKLLEVTHFHLFTVPVFLLIITHLFMLTGLSSRAKVWWIAGGFGSSLAHVLAPWLVRYGGASWAWTYAVTGVGLTVTTVWMTAYPIWAMWWGRPPARADLRAGRPESDASDVE